MAKIRVAQIKDLSLSTDGIITIGSETIKPIVTNLATATANEAATTVISGLTVEGNQLKPQTTNISSILNGYATTTDVTNAINDLDKDAFSLVELNDKTLNGYTIAENDGIIAKGTTATALLEFATAPTATNKVATIADITAAIPTDYVTTETFNTYKQTVENTYATIANLEALTTRVTTAESDIDALEGRMTTAESDIDALEGRMTTAEGEIDALQEAVGQLGNYTAGSGIAITDRVISTTVTLNYDSTDNEIQLLDKENGAVIGTVDAKAFLKDGMVSGASVETNPAGQPAGTYIKLTFNTQDPVSGNPSHEDIYINVTSLIDVYEAGNDGIVVNGRQISHKAGSVTAETEKGAVSVNTIKVPVVKVDGYGHVIALTEAEWTMPASTALESVSGSGANFIEVEVGAKDTAKNQAITVSATLGTFDGENGLATTAAVAAYVQGQLTASATKHEHLEYTAVSADETAGYVSLAYTQTPVSTAKANFDVYQNGLKLKSGEYRIDTLNNAVVITPETSVGVKFNDEFEVCYVAYHTPEV